MKKIKNMFPTAIILILVGALFTWSLYKLMYEIITDVLLDMGIVGDLYQNVIIVVAAGLVLILRGKKLERYLK